MGEDNANHKRLEAALLASEHRYELLVGAITDYIYTVEIQQGQVVTIAHGPGCLAVTGYNPAEYEANPSLWYQMIYPEDRETVLAQNAQILSGQAAPPFEHRIIRKDGSVRWIKNTPVPRYDEQGQLIGYDGFVSDITERKTAEAERERTLIAEWEQRRLAELLALENARLYEQARQEIVARTQAGEALKKSEANLRAILDNSLQGFILIDPDYKIQAFNRVATEGVKLILGKRLKEGSSIYNIIPKEDLDEFKESFSTALAGKSVKVEKQVNIGDRARWFEFHYKPVFADDGQVIGVCFNTVNIDEQKQATAALAESEARLLAEMLSVLAINRALVSEIEVDSLLEFIMAQAQHLMNAAGTAVLLLSDDEQQLKVATPGESWLPIKPGSLLPFQGSLAGLAMSQQQVQISNQAQVDERTGSIRALLQPYYQVRSLLCAPLIAQSRNLGILLVWSEHEQNFTAQDGRLMSLFADQAALALHNAHLHMRNRQLAIEQERHRLAQDLHDSVTQSLYSIRLAAQASLKLLKQDTDSRPREAIEHIQSLSQAALIEMRKQIYDLYPTHQTSEGLVRALGHYCRVLRDEYSLAIDFTAASEPPLSIYQRETLYGIAKEALWNVVKHANATRVDVALARENDQIILTIKDNGAGFDPLFIRAEAMGLRSMEERAKLLDGNLELQTKPGQGTRLMVRLAISSM